VDVVLPFEPVVADAPRPDLASLYDETVDVAWRMLSRLGVPKPDLEDAVQDVFVIAQRRISTLRADAKATTWVGGIAVRVAHDYRRHGLRHPVDPLEPHAPLLEDRRARPDEAASRAQQAQLFEQLLQKLEPNQRDVFVLSELEQWSGAEIAELVGVPQNTVYSRLRLARARINELVLELEGGPR
jgi:RNA polymerase sigma-70 factor (ECF subfamily)